MEAQKVLSLMNETANLRLMVVDGKKLVGFVSLKDLLEFIAVKTELDGPGSRN
jgi:predicted transcriptional regulator